MRIFKTRLFAKWAKKESLTDTALCKAVAEIEQGLVDADLGGHVYKKRIPLKGKGKRGGARSILAYQVANKAFFIFGYTKNEKANVSQEELAIAKAVAKELLETQSVELAALLKQGKLIEVNYAG